MYMYIGGGIVILNKTDYHNKIMGFLRHNNTYTPTFLNFIIESYKKIISNDDKAWSTLIKYRTTTPAIFGLAKIRKEHSSSFVP